MQYPVSVGEKGLTIVSGGINNDIAFCFHDSLDYMAWCTYMAAQKKNTDNADCYIMGDFSTFTELGKIAKKYKRYSAISTTTSVERLWLIHSKK